MRWSIVIVEDDQTMIESLAAVLKRQLGEVSVDGSGFRQAVTTIAEVMPDVVILDISDALDEDPHNAVKPAWDYVWDMHFCPVIFHSAYNVADYENLCHPFTRYVVKGPKSQSRVADCIKSFEPEIEGLRKVRRELSRHAGETMRYTGRLVRTNDNPTADQTELFLRMVRRRMAAALDHADDPQKHIQAWEQYICPPIGDDLLTGDLIRETRANSTDVLAHRLVLSPSCDLVCGRSPAAQVLVAECVAVNEFLAKASISTKKLHDSAYRSQRLFPELRRDQVAGLTVLPGLPDVLPLMAANLKRLSLVPFADIGRSNDKDKPFIRVASLDSPFRERLAWAYLQVAGRPGVPDVDCESLADTIVQTIAPIGLK